MIKCVMNWLEKNNCILEEDKALVEYGIGQGVSGLLGIVLALLIGYKMMIFVYSIIFIIAFIPLRMYAGGYHAKTRQRCAAISLILLIICFTGLKYWRLPLILTFSIGIIEIFILYLSIPTSSTYILEPIEKKIYQKKGRKILLFIFLFMILMQILKLEKMIQTITTMLSLVLFLVALVIIQETCKKYNCST